MSFTKFRWLPWLSAATLLAGVLAAAPPVSANSAAGGVPLLSVPKMTEQTAQLCLDPVAGTVTAFGATTNAKCYGGFAKVRIWQLSPRYNGTVLVAVSAARMTPHHPPTVPYWYQLFNHQAWPAARIAMENGSNAVVLSTGNAGLRAAPGAVGAGYTVATGSTVAVTAAGTTITAAGATTQHLSITAPTAGVTFRGQLAMWTIPAEPHAQGRHGSGMAQVWRVFVWHVPASGGTLHWSFDGAPGQAITVGPATPLPRNWRVTASGGITANPTIGASYSYGLPAAQAAAALKQAETQGAERGALTITASGGAHVAPTGTDPLTLAGTIATFRDPAPGQGVTVTDQLHGQATMPAGASHWAPPPWPADAQEGSFSPVGGMRATLTQNVVITHQHQAIRRQVTITPRGTQMVITALTLSAGAKRPVGQWVPLRVSVTRNGQPVSGTVHLTGRGPRGTRLRSATVRLQRGTGTDAVTAAAAGTVSLTAAYGAMKAGAQAQLLPLFPWWILLLLIAALALAAGYWRIRARRSRSTSPPATDEPPTAEPAPDPDPPTEGTGNA